MRTEYDFSESRKNPYTKQLKRQATIRLDASAIDYFKQKRRPEIQWTASGVGPGRRKKQSIE